MIWFVIGLVVAVMLIVGIFRDGIFETILGKIGMSFLILLISLCCALILGLISSLIMSSTKIECIADKQSQPIYALSDNVGVDGSFFIGCGYVDSDLSYFYIEETELGLHADNVKASHSYIIESDNPSLTTISYRWANKGWNWLGACMKDNEYIFAVPAGSVISNYQIDLK